MHSMETWDYIIIQVRVHLETKKHGFSILWEFVFLKGVTAKMQIDKFHCCYISAPEHLILKFMSLPQSFPVNYGG